MSLEIDRELERMSIHTVVRPDGRSTEPILMWPDNSGTTKSVIGFGFYQMIMATCLAKSGEMLRQLPPGFFDGLDWLVGSSVPLGRDMSFEKGSIDIPLEVFGTVRTNEILSRMPMPSGRGTFETNTWSNVSGNMHAANSLDKMTIATINTLKTIASLKEVSSETIAHAMGKPDLDFTSCVEYAVAALIVAGTRAGVTQRTHQEIVFFARRLIEEMNRLKGYEREVHSGIYSALKEILGESTLNKIVKKLAAYNLTLAMYANLQVDETQNLVKHIQSGIRTGGNVCAYCGRVVTSIPSNDLDAFGRKIPRGRETVPMTYEELCISLNCMTAEQLSESPFAYLLGKQIEKIAPAAMIEVAKVAGGPVTIDPITGRVSVRGSTVGALWSQLVLSEVVTRTPVPLHDLGSEEDSSATILAHASLHRDDPALLPSFPSLQHILDQWCFVWETTIGLKGDNDDDNAPVLSTLNALMASFGAGPARVKGAIVTYLSDTEPSSEILVLDQYKGMVSSMFCENVSKASEVKECLKRSTFAFPPIQLGTILRAKKLANSELCKRSCAYKSFTISLQTSLSRLNAALKTFYTKTKFDPIDAFANNTSILSGKTPFSPYIPKQPIRPHEFQKKYLESIMRYIWAECTNTRATKDPENDFVYERSNVSNQSTYVDPRVLGAALLGSNFDPDVVPQEEIERVRKICEIIGRHTQISAEIALFHYACGLCEEYKNADPSNQQNRSAILVIGYIGILHARKLHHIKRLRNEPFALLERDEFRIDFEDLICEATDATETAESVEIMASEESFLSDSFRMNSSSPDTSSMASPTNNNIREKIIRDMRIVLLCVDHYRAPADAVSIFANTQKIDIEYNSSLPGAGKTTLPVLGAVILHKIKGILRDSLVRHFEIAFICDHALIRNETYQRIVALNSEIKASIIETGPDGKLCITSNFSTRGTVRSAVGRIKTEECKPGFKCDSRDIFIMDSRMMVPYVLGRRDGASNDFTSGGSWYGNPRAFVFFDEFGANLGNFDPMNALSKSSGDLSKVQSVFEEHMPGILVLGNAPQRISLAGASMVPVDHITGLIHSRQPNRLYDVHPNVKGKIYVGSHYVYAWGQHVEAWNLCPVDMFEDFFRGVCEPLAKRTIGHHAAINLRNKIKECIASGNPIYARLSEMENYMSFDLGIFDGESVANFAVGMLYLVMLYATKYLGPDQDVDAACSDVQPYIDGHKIIFPAGAPWPKSRFLRREEQGFLYPSISPPEFLANLGIPSTYVAPTVPLNQPRTTFERICKELTDSYGEVEERTIFVFDPHPMQLAIAIGASVTKKSISDFEKYAHAVISEAVIADTEAERAVAAELAELDRQAKHGTTDLVGNAKAIAGGTGRVVTQVMTPQEIQQQAIAIAAKLALRFNQLTQNPYSAKDANGLSILPVRSEIEQYLLSMGIICMSSDESDKAIQDKYEFIKKKNRVSKIKMIVCNSICAYGVNVEKATCAIMSARGALTVSPQTMAQFFSRVGRSGMSDEAVLYLDAVTLARIVEHTMHDSAAEGALIPAIFVALDDFMKSTGAYRNYTNRLEQELSDMYSAQRFENTPQMLDRHLVERVSNLLTSLIEPFGLSGYFTPQIEIFVGAILTHIHEPFGISGYCMDESGLPVVTRSTYPRTDGTDVDSLMKAVRFVMKRFARTRDNTCFDNYSEIMAVEDSSGTSLTTRFIAHVAQRSIQRLALK